MTTVADYSFARFTAAQLKAGGVVGVGRYVDYVGAGGNPKVITKVEYDGLVAGGITVVLVFEDTAARAATGTPGGGADATYTEAFAKALGYPADGVIYYAVDYDEGNPASVLPYFEGLASVNKTGYRHRPYGGADLVNLLVARGLTDAGWVSNATAWSHGASTPFAAMVQTTTHTAVIPGAVAGSWDQDNLIQADWARAGATVPASTTPPTTEDDMPLNAADITLIQQMLDVQFAPGAELYDRVVQAAIQAIKEQPANIPPS